MADWNAPGIYYKLRYRRVRPNGTWNEVTFSDHSVGKFLIPNPGYYTLWEFDIQAGNRQGLGPKSPIVSSYSGQDPPAAARPEDVTVETVSARSVELSWTPASASLGSVDGYKVSRVKIVLFYHFSIFLLT